MTSDLRRKHCISCGADLSEDIVLIGDQYPSAIYPAPNSDYRKKIQASSLNVCKCLREQCGLVQLAGKYNLNFVFENYPFVSGTTATMNEILCDVLNEGYSCVDLTKEDVVLDIGGNDGTMLGMIDKQIAKRVNIDAANGVESVVSDMDYVRVQSLFNADVYEELNLPSPKLIFSVAMFYHLENPVEFCKNVSKIMSDKSAWIIQMTYLGSMLESNIYDNIVHEHVAYYSLKSLEYLMNQVGLEIFDAKIANSYGGSIRVNVRKKGSKVSNSGLNDIKSFKNYESQSGVNTVDALVRFNDRIKLLKKTTRELVLHLNDREGKITALGASTKGNMLCQFLELDKENFDCALDNNNKKIGLIMTGSDIPVVDEVKILNNVPKYLFVLPYYYVGFFEIMVSRMLKKGQICYLIVPLPEPHFIKLQG